MLRLFGTAGIEGSGQFPKRGYLLIAILTLASSKLGRLEVATKIWEDSPAAQAFANLRYVMSRIRKWEAANGKRILQTDRDRVWLSHECRSDLSEILGTDQLGSPAQLYSYMQLWRGELLQFEGPFGVELEHVIAAARDLVSRHFTRVLVEGALRFEGKVGDAAFELADQIAPLDEAIGRSRMSYLSASGRPLEAATYYRKLRRRLQQELSAAPEVDTRALASRLSLEAPTALRPHEERFPSLIYMGLPRILVLPPGEAQPGAGAAIPLARSLVTDLSLHLARMRTFAVIAPFTANQLASSNPIEAGRQVDAPYVVSTKLVPGRSRNDLWIALMHSGSGEILLADSVSVAPSELVKSQVQIADGIAQAMAAQVSACEMLRYRQTGEASAFVHYLLGSERLRYDLPSIRKAKRHFQRASSVSPGFAPALAMSARALNYEWLVLGRESTETLDEALALAVRAVEIDPLAPAGHWEVGHSLLYMRRLDEALERMRVARERGPHIADLMADEADVLVHLGRFDEAVETVDEAMQLNPGMPDEYLWVRGSALYFQEDYERAVLDLSGMRDTMPVARLLAASYAMLGDLNAAAIHRDRWLERYPDFEVSNWAAQIPFRNTEVQKRMIEGMRLAGFS
jgi:DNA-binding SARP family transcriptional activator/tetratricopeptide (TPR) repeat protein